MVRLGVFPGKHNPDDGVSGALLGVGIKAFNAGASIGVRGERKGLGVRADISGIGGRRLQAHIKGGLGRGNSLPGDRSPRGALNVGIRTPFFYVGAGLKTDKPDPRQWTWDYSHSVEILLSIDLMLSLINDKQ